MHAKVTLVLLASQLLFTTAQAADKIEDTLGCSSTIHYSYWDSEYGMVSAWCCYDVPNNSKLDSCGEEGDDSDPVIGGSPDVGGGTTGGGTTDTEPEPNDDPDVDPADDNTPAEECVNLIERYVVDITSRTPSWCCDDLPNRSDFESCYDHPVADVSYETASGK